MFLSIVHKIEHLFGKDFQCVCEGQVAGEFCCGRRVGVKDFSYCFADSTGEGNFEAEYFDFRHAKGPWTRRNISVDAEKKCAGCKEIVSCFV
jgi:hypothetical protein